MAKKQPQRVITIAATKGGVGKTTLAAALAVRAASEGSVALIDAAKQKSLQDWLSWRPEQTNPRLLQAEAEPEAIELAYAEGWQWLFIDTPPAMLMQIENAVACCDLVLIPTKTSPLDLEAIKPTIQIAEKFGKPYAFILNMVDPTTRATAAYAEVLQSRGKLLKPYIAQRQAYVTGMVKGLTGPEVERGSGCSTEINALWDEVKKLIAQAVRGK